MQGQSVLNVEKQPKGPTTRSRGRTEPSEDPHAIKIQGALLLQAMLRLASPHNQVILQRCVLKGLADLSR